MWAALPTSIHLLCVRTGCYFLPSSPRASPQLLKLGGQVPVAERACCPQGRDQPLPLWDPLRMADRTPSSVSTLCLLNRVSPQVGTACACGRTRRRLPRSGPSRCVQRAWAGSRASQCGGPQDPVRVAAGLAWGTWSPPQLEGADTCSPPSPGHHQQRKTWQKRGRCPEKAPGDNVWWGTMDGRRTG